MASEVCARCGREVDYEDPAYIDGESIEGNYVCGHCVTGAEQQTFDDDAMSMLDEVALEQERKEGDDG